MWGRLGRGREGVYVRGSHSHTNQEVAVALEGRFTWDVDEVDGVVTLLPFDKGKWVKVRSHNLFGGPAYATVGHGLDRPGTESEEDIVPSDVIFCGVLSGVAMFGVT